MELTVDSSTRIHFLIGDPIAQVIGPTLISQKMADGGYNGVMLPLHVSKVDLPAVLAGFNGIQNLDSVLITVPHKVSCVSHCSSLSSRAEKLGAVNIMRRKQDGTWHGDNFDGPGFIRGLENHGHSVSGKKVYMAGAGGAGSSISVSLLDAGAESVTIYDKNVSTAHKLLGSLEQHYPGRVSVTAPRSVAAFDIVVNATSAGLREGDPLPVDLTDVRVGTLVADVITKPAVTPFMRDALARGCLVTSGTDMLDGQIDLLYRFVIGEEIA
ncbi:shikimate 5-dehydrogenase protein (plasmid) [Rhizobium phaseoli]|uniref:shikimate dehydrogenase family protein n=1 Tax=Rhizobium phaseoli TaxID=396 RepID=UPI0007EBAB0B|nr:shikimate dehydrogenase [Rhizobium phaseoli]ANL51041.1 shikimate 5-dehydrogenase protein [Rhizobium phaseoli]